MPAKKKAAKKKPAAKEKKPKETPKASPAPKKPEAPKVEKAEKRKEVLIMPEIEMVVIENKRASGIGLPGVVTKKGITLDYGLRLAPGENDVPQDEWERVRTHKTVKMYLDARILIDKGPGRAKKLTDGLDALEKHEAIAQINKCSAPQILENWYSKSQKDFLREKIQEKLQSLVKDEE